MPEALRLVQADWPAPPGIHAVVSTRRGGVSPAPWHSLNLGLHVGDAAAAVAENRRRLHAALQDIAPCAAPQWLQQVHGVTVVAAEADADRRAHYCPEADAVFTREPDLPCVVMTADCLPVFFCDSQGQQVAVAHAGWRGLCEGVLEATVARFSVPAQVMAWLGPAIGPQAFEVGCEVRAAFLQQQPAAAACFQPAPGAGKYLADIYALARLRLRALGLSQIHGGNFCTLSQPEQFFSYRRDGQTGRMAAVIWRSRSA